MVATKARRKKFHTRRQPTDQKTETEPGAQTRETKTGFSRQAKGTRATSPANGVSRALTRKQNRTPATNEKRAATSSVPGVN